ncbi:MAG TPA: cbb3-type cytochrome c oxidase subunit I [Acidimicrobiales bacterium]|nr:cbb3-type cytochrome c oxidase subunit I [Acidimicrobiales bacterium]
MTTTTPEREGRSADHKTVGTLFIAVALLFLVATGVLALILRAQLTAPDTDVLEVNTYRQLFTLHGVFGIFLFLAPAWIGVATAMVPLQIGAARLAFPRVQAFSLWLLVAGAAAIVTSPFATGAEVVNGWALNTPLAEGKAYSGDALDLLILGLITVGAALLIAAVNLIVTIVKFRAPGLTQRRSPIFTWSVLVSSAVLLFALPVLMGALAMLFADRHYGARIFNGFTGSGGGNPAMWPRLFWFAAYPLLWALLLPALGVLTEIVAVFSRRRLFSHSRALGAIGAIGVLAFAGWGSELPDLGNVRYLFAVGALLVLLPVASLVLNWLGTLGSALAQGRRSQRGAPGAAPPDLRAIPMLHALGAVTVLAVGLVGATVLAVRSGTGTHRTYWAVATQHTLYFGTATFAFVAALHYWAPKMWGRHLSAGLGHVQFLLLLVGTQLAFLPMYVLGLQHMHIHLASYPDDRGWEPANIASTIGAVIIGLALLVLVINVVVSIVLRYGRKAEADPWGGHTLEWATASPPPPHNFHAIPEVRSEAPVLDLAAAGVSPVVDAPALEPGVDDQQTKADVVGASR